MYIVLSNEANLVVFLIFLIHHMYIHSIHWLILYSMNMYIYFSKFWIILIWYSLFANTLLSIVIDPSEIQSIKYFSEINVPNWVVPLSSYTSIVSHFLILRYSRYSRWLVSHCSAICIFFQYCFARGIDWSSEISRECALEKRYWARWSFLGSHGGV